MRVYVTGGTGYIGRALVARLREAGHEVAALVRPTSDRSVLERLGVRCLQGDVTDRYSMREGMSGAEWVVHAAALLDFRASPGAMHRINAEGSYNVASLAYKLGVGHFLSISSVAVFGGSPADGSPADEKSPPRLPLPSHYSRTKAAGQASIEEWAEQGLRVRTVYPGLVYGPPGKHDGTNALIRALALGRLPLLVGSDRIASWIHLEDVVDALLKVMERTEPGGRHLLAGEGSTVGKAALRVAGLAGVRPPKLSLPPPLARVFLALAAPLYRLRGRRPPFNDQQIRSLSRHWHFDDSKARRELDWCPRGLDKGMPETVRYLLDA